MDIKLVDRREANRRYLNVVWRWLLVVGGAASAGWIIFNALHSARQSAIALATTGVAVATAIAFFSDIMGLLHGCRAYLDGLTDSLQSLTSGFWESWGSLTAIVVALYAFEADRHELPAGTPDPWYVVYSNRPAPDDGPRLATISALYAKSAVHNARNQWTTGVSFTQTEIDVSLKGLRRIMEALKACGSVPNEPAVELKIEGFASSKEFGDPKRRTRRNSRTSLMWMQPTIALGLPTALLKMRSARNSSTRGTGRSRNGRVALRQLLPLPPD